MLINHKSLLISFIAYLVFMFFSVQSYAHAYSGHSGHMHDMHEQNHENDCTGNLNLSDEQRKKFDYIRDKTRHQTKSLKSKLSDLFEKLDNLYAKERPDVDKISKLHNEIHKIKGQIIILKLKSRNQKYDLLNEEQRKKFSGHYKRNDSRGYRSGHHGHMDMHHMMK